LFKKEKKKGLVLSFKSKKSGMLLIRRRGAASELQQWLLDFALRLQLELL
jgi:hypothetical protein